MKADYSISPLQVLQTPLWLHGMTAGQPLCAAVRQRICIWLLTEISFMCAIRKAPLRPAVTAHTAFESLDERTFRSLCFKVES